jgi:hypothetical protein
MFTTMHKDPESRKWQWNQRFNGATAINVTASGNTHGQDHYQK